MDADTATASDFREPLLRALGDLTALSSGTSVPMDEVLGKLYRSLGLTETEFGTDGPTGTPRLRLLAQQAFNKNLRPAGLADNAGRGQWCLTTRGVIAARVLLSAGGRDPLSHLHMDYSPVATYPGGGGLSWNLWAEGNTYHADPYIIHVASLNTECFRQFSDRSEICAGCGISSACRDAVIDRLVLQAMALRERDSRTDVPDPPPERTESDEIDAIVNELNQNVPPPTVSRMRMSVSAKCARCATAIPKGTPGVLVTGKGAYHEGCFDPIGAGGSGNSP